MPNSAATYDNSLTPIAKTRILSDRNIVNKDSKGYAESGIYFDFDKDMLNNQFRILTIGSNDLDNPYFGGFFMFSGKFPDQYPFFPPHILAKTQGKNTRFHPNYYTNGKCCLSILGTWSGPPWTSCQNLGTVSQALKSLFIDNPITQEPGWESYDIKNIKAKSYSAVIEYRTLEIAVLQMLETPPSGFESFLNGTSVITLGSPWYKDLKGIIHADKNTKLSNALKKLINNKDPQLYEIKNNLNEFLDKKTFIYGSTPKGLDKILNNFSYKELENHSFRSAYSLISYINCFKKKSLS